MTVASASGVTAGTGSRKGRLNSGDACMTGPHSLDELIDRADRGMGLIRRWVDAAEVRCEVLPASSESGRVLCELQVTTGTPLGAMAYETGGILIELGWLRLLGSGHERLPRNLADWNRTRSTRFRLIADDAVGGFFALNQGAFGDDVDTVYYWAPDSLRWEPMGFGFSDFLQWSLSICVSDFYQNLRWGDWEREVGLLPGDQCFMFDPFLWTKEGSVRESVRRVAPVAEVFDLKADLQRRSTP